MAAVPSLVTGGLKGRSRWGIAATLGVLTVAALAIAAGLTVRSQGAQRLDEVAAEANVAHLVLYGDPDALAGLADDPRLTATAGPFAVLTGPLLVLPDDEVVLRTTVLASPDTAVGRPLQRTGQWLDPASDDEIVLDHSLAKDLGFGPGDTLRLRLGDATAEYTVAGTAVDLTDCGYPQCDPGRVFLSESGFARLDAPEHGWTFFARVADADAADATFGALQADLGTTLTGGDTWPDTRGDLLAVDEGFGQFVTGFGAFVLVAAAVVVAGSTAARVAARRREIGLLGAVGATPRQVLTAIVGEQVVLGVIAAVLGWALAGLLAPSLQFGIADVVGASGTAWSPGTLAVIVVLVVAILALATLVPAWRAARQPVTDVLRDVPPEATGVLAHGLPNRLSFLGVREAATRPGRSLLTALAIAVAVIGAIVASGFVRSIDRVVADPARTGDPWDALGVVGDADADAVAAAVAATPGVASSFLQADARGTLQGGAFLLRGIGGQPGFDIGEGRLPTSSGEALAGYGFLTRFGVDVGDTITVDTAGGPITATIVGWYRDTEDAGEILIVPIGDLAAVNPDADVVFAVAEPGLSDRDLAQRLAANVPAGVRVEPYVSETDMLEPFRVVLWLIAGLLALVAGANLLTTLLTTTRESARSLGVLGSVGFTPRQLVGQGAMAAGAIAAGACLVGVPLGTWLYGVLLDGVTSQIGLGPGVSGFPGLVTLVVVVLLALAVAAGLGALATARMAHRPVSDLVRWE